jgi:predicted ATPase
MTILALTSITHILCGDCAAATTQLDELAGFAEEKGSLYWKAFAMWLQGWLLALAGKTAEAVNEFTSGTTAWRSTGATLYAPTQSSLLAEAYAILGQFDESQRSISEAITTVKRSKEAWYEAEVHRIAGEVALKSPTLDTEKAEKQFDRALAVARRGQGSGFKLRVANHLEKWFASQSKLKDILEDVLESLWERSVIGSLLKVSQHNGMDEPPSDTNVFSFPQQRSA